MSRLLLFIKKIHLFIIFLLIELISFNYYYNYSDYASSKIIAFSSYIVGNISSVVHDIEEYFMLKQENQNLTATIADMHNRIKVLELEREHYIQGSMTADSSLIESGFEIFFAKVVKNSISKQHNYIMIDKGTKNGISKDMSVISGNAVIGYIDQCYESYSIVMPMLNRDFKSSGKDISGQYFGSIRWDGDNYDEISLIDVPKYANIEVGDTIVTTDFSSRFAPNLKIGIVSDFKLVDGLNYKAKVKLFEDFSKLNNVIIIKNSDLEERLSIENEYNVY